MRNVIYPIEYNDWVNRTVRQFDFRIEFNGRELTISDISSIKINTDLLNGDTFTIGSSVSETIEFDVFMDSDIPISKFIPIKPYISLYTEVLIDRVIKEVWQEVCLGVFYINPDGITKKGLKSVNIKASSMLSNPDYGGKIYAAPTLAEGQTFSISIHEAMSEICNKLGISLDTTLPNIYLTNRDHINGMTYKELVNYVATLYGGYAKINNKGNLEFFKMTDTKYVYDTDKYISLSKQDEVLDIQSFICATGEKTEGEETKPTSITSGSGTIAQTVELICPDMTQSILDGILNTYKGYGYSAISAKIFGNPRLEAGDRIKIIDVKGRTHEFPLQTISYNISGSGINMDVKSVYKVNSIAKGTSIRKSISELQQDIITSKLIVTDQLEVINGTIERLEVTDELHAQKISLNEGHITDLYATKATVDELNATKALIGDLEVDTTIVKELSATNAKIDGLIAGEVTIEKLDVVELKVDDLTVSNSANIEAITAVQEDIKDLQENKADKSELHEHENKNVLDTITNDKITSWDNKSDFSGSYNDLTNKPTIPSVEGLVTETFVTEALKSKSDTSHKHDDLYAPIGHKHDDLYAPIGHKHDDLYAPKNIGEDTVVSIIAGLLETISDLEARVTALESSDGPEDPVDPEPEDPNPEPEDQSNLIKFKTIDSTDGTFKINNTNIINVADCVKSQETIDSHTLYTCEYQIDNTLDNKIEFSNLTSLYSIDSIYGDDSDKLYCNNCTALEILNLDNWNSTHNYTKFDNCSSLKTIYMRGTLGGYRYNILGNNLPDRTGKEAGSIIVTEAIEESILSTLEERNWTLVVEDAD